ncbi:MAG: alpha/beta hydrolase, partial [Weeksellaceae bacterium]|nr:alpha/beta hydrolase [Weeksellaceae bacterium]
MKIYQISGLGANEKAFKNLRLNPDFELVYIPWLQPEKEESLQHYTERMLEKINLNEDFLLMGLSFGGIIVKEMNRFVHPQFNFLISTIKDRSEMPNYMRFSSHTNIHKAIPPAFLTSDSFLSYSVIRKIYSTRLMDLKEIFEFRNHYYLKWAMNQIVNWRNDILLPDFVHYHGNKDIVFPYSNL